MKRYFVDSVYWIALANPNDQWSEKAFAVDTQIRNSTLVTTEEVLLELLNFYAESGSFLRQKAVDLARSILVDPRIQIVSRTESSLLDALELYESRLDKGYSLTDCISMNVCRELGVSEVLTTDKHFQQEGFSSLL